MRIAKLIYGHRFGTDCLLAIVPDGMGYNDLPEITNEYLVDTFSIAGPELEEREDEWAEWEGICDFNHPTHKGWGLSLDPCLRRMGD